MPIREVLDPVALVIGYMLMAAGGVGLSGVLVYFPINYAWKKFGDTIALVRVMREADRQGVKIWR